MTSENGIEVENCNAKDIDLVTAGLRHVQFRDMETNVTIRSRSRVDLLLRKQHIIPETSLADAEAKIDVDEYGSTENYIYYTSEPLHYGKCGQVYKHVFANSSHEMTCEDTCKVENTLGRVI